MSHQAQIDSFKQDPEIRKVVRSYSHIQLWKQVGLVAFDWSVIGLSIAAALTWPHLGVYLLSVIVIATRQHALLIVMHESTHFRFSKNLWFNDVVSDLVAAYPFLITTRLYRDYHMPHHRYTNTERDPDWMKKVPHSEWHFPKSNAGLLKIFGKLLLVGGLQRIDLMTFLAKEDWKKWVYWTVISGAAITMGFWQELLLFWFVPMLTVFPLLQRLRSISDHFGLEQTHELNSSRNIVVGSLEGFLLSPHNVNFHLVHHLFPSVPCYNLKALHQRLMAHPTYAQLAHNNQSFFFKKNSVWSDLRTLRGAEGDLAQYKAG